MHQSLEYEIERRRTLALFRPDAGKTTMTEKLLLYGGAGLCGSSGTEGFAPCNIGLMEIESSADLRLIIGPAFEYGGIALIFSIRPKTKFFRYMYVPCVY